MDVWKTLELPVATQQILLLSRRKPKPECVYPELRKAAE